MGVTIISKVTYPSIGKYLVMDPREQNPDLTINLEAKPSPPGKAAS